MVETSQANLVAGVAWLRSTYTIRLNNRHKLTGHVLSGRYKAQLVEGSGDGYLRTACDYVHLNPIRAELLGVEDRLLAYPWSYYLFIGLALFAALAKDGPPLSGLPGGELRLYRNSSLCWISRSGRVVG